MGSPRRRAVSGMKRGCAATPSSSFFICAPELLGLTSKLEVVIQNLAPFFEREVADINDDLALLQKGKGALLQIPARAIIDIVARRHHDLRALLQHRPDIGQPMIPAIYQVGFILAHAESVVDPEELGRLIGIPVFLHFVRFVQLERRGVPLIRAAIASRDAMVVFAGRRLADQQNKSMLV